MVLLLLLLFPPCETIKQMQLNFWRKECRWTLFNLETLPIWRLFVLPCKYSTKPILLYLGGCLESESSWNSHLSLTMKFFLLQLPRACLSFIWQQCIQPFPYVQHTKASTYQSLLCPSDTEHGKTNTGSLNLL
jgi:hypothetical protein